MIIVRHVLLALLFLGFIAAPHIAGLLGVKARSIENRPLATAPALTSRNLLDASYFRELSSFLRDNLPGRVEATLAYNWSVLNLLRGSPSANVYEGRDGEMFLDVEFLGPCSRNVTVEQLVKDIRSFSARLQRTGRDLFVTFAPNKSYVLPEKMSPALAQLAKCPDARRTELRERMTAANDVRWIDLWSLLDSFEASSEEPLFPKLGRHSTALTGVLFAKGIIDAIQPGLWDEASVVESPAVVSTSELPQRFMGLDVPQSYKNFRVDRGLDAKPVLRKEKLSPTSQRDTMFFTNPATTKPLITRKALVFHDSFMDASMDELAEYFAEITFIHWGEFRTQPAQIAAAIARSDIVVIEYVEDLKEEAIPNTIGERAEGPGILKRVEELLSAQAAAAASALAGPSTSTAPTP